MSLPRSSQIHSLICERGPGYVPVGGTTDQYPGVRTASVIRPARLPLPHGSGVDGQAYMTALRRAQVRGATEPSRCCSA